ncbi:MAG: hypothetical protein JST81_11035 [Bacteroidetes bacterium]|nr:hypothetical protein [Bacteroidota bacterium]
MKKFILSVIVLSSMFFVSCKKDKTENPQGNDSFINPFTTTGNWKVADFRNNGNDETANYLNVLLVINPNNTLSVSNDVMATNGTWNFEQAEDRTLFLQFDLNMDNVSIDAWRNISDHWKVIKLEQNALILSSTSADKEMTLQKEAR